MGKVGAVTSATDLLMKARMECWYRLLVWRATSSPRPIVLIYQMGKVASSSIMNALREVDDLRVFHLHLMAPDSTRRLKAAMQRKGFSADEMVTYALGRALYRGIIESGHRARIITLVREPISRNISFYFQNLDLLWKTAGTHERVGVDRLVEAYLDRFNHDRTLEWFDREFKAALGVDIYEHEFPQKLGYLKLNAGRYEILILRSDLDDEVKGKCLGQFLGVEGLTILPANVTAQKPYAETHREFLRKLRLPRWYVDRMLDSKYTRHFFSPEERDTFRAKWSGQCD